jgi:hypothetical protein
MNRKKLYILLAGLSLAGYAWLAWNVSESSEHPAIPTVCMFKEITHLPCPSCGTTRSLVLLLSGHVQESLLTNPFGMVLALALVILPLWVAIDTLRKSDSLFRRYTSAERAIARHWWIAVPAAALVVLNWCWNIAKGL